MIKVRIDAISICQFFYPDLRIEIFLEKDGAAKESNVHFEIGVKAPAAK